MILSADLELTYEHDVIVTGCDEVGRGPLAGSVIAACVIFDRNVEMIKGINDSKKLSIKMRENLSREICDKYSYSIGEASVAEIEEINILEATKLAIVRATENLRKIPRVILVDGNMKFKDKRYISIIKGDQKIYTIACASIIAKVYRDKLMKDLSKEYPAYLWEKNAGYGTKAHFMAINEQGITKHHRKSFISSPLLVHREIRA